MVTVPSLSQSSKPIEYMSAIPFPRIGHDAKTITEVMAGKAPWAPKCKTLTMKKLARKKIKGSTSTVATSSMLTTFTIQLIKSQISPFVFFPTLIILSIQGPSESGFPQRSKCHKQHHQTLFQTMLLKRPQ